jgi:hypothetical protein
MITTLNQLFTGKDNVTHDLVRWLAALVILVALFLTVYCVVFKSTEFNLESFGIGFGALFTTVGVALKLKETTEPAASEDPKIQ